MVIDKYERWNKSTSQEVIRRLNDEVIEYENFLTEMEACEWRKNRTKGMDEYLKEIKNEKELCDRMKNIIEDK